MKSSKIIKIVTVALVWALIAVSVFCIMSLKKVYNAYTEAEASIGREAPEMGGKGQSASVYGMSASLSLSINCIDGKVRATVKNDFKFLPSTVTVIVQLYSSDTYAESYGEMTLVGTNSVADLEMGKTVSTELEIENADKFWLARMKYKIGNTVWTSRQTGACHISSSGEFLGYI